MLNTLFKEYIKWLAGYLSAAHEYFQRTARPGYSREVRDEMEGVDFARSFQIDVRTGIKERSN